MKTTAEVAEELGVSQRRIAQLIKSGEIVGIMRGGSWFVPPDQVEIAKQRNRKPGAKPKK